MVSGRGRRRTRGSNFIGAEEKKLVAEVLDSGILSGYVAHNGPWFGGGPMVHALEEELCRISA